MPLVSMSTLNKTFPERFAERFTVDPMKKQTTTRGACTVIRGHNDNNNDIVTGNDTADYTSRTGHLRRDLLKKKQSEEMVFSSTEDSIIKRLRTPITGIDDYTEEDNYQSHQHFSSSTSQHDILMETESNYNSFTNNNNHTMMDFSSTAPISLMDLVHQNNTTNSSNRNSTSSNNNGALTQAWWAVRPKSRGSCARSTSRTTTSLDSVDLWESDSEESNPNETTGSISSDSCMSKEGFDKINGVVINPRKTFDFSDLRRMQSPMVGDGEQLRKIQTLRPECWKHMETKVTKVPETTPPVIRLRPDRQHKSEKKTHEKKQTVADRLKHLQQKQKDLEVEKVQKLEHKDVQIKETVRKQPNQTVQKLKLDKDIKAKTEEPKRMKGILSPPKDNHVSMNSLGFGTKGKPRVRMVPGLHTEHTNSKMLMSSSKRTPQSETSVSSDVFPPQCVKDMTVEEAASITYPLTKNPRTLRRQVKFNTVVSVREGGLNKKDTLRSSKNSAQLFKQKYLLGIPQQQQQMEETVLEEFEESRRPTTPTPPTDPQYYAQLAF